MEAERCYYCQGPIPAGQSFYEGRGVKVCLNCFRGAKACTHCGFPALELKNHPKLGKVCNFCLAERPPQVQGKCHLCQREIREGEREYADHGVQVCLNCFNTAKSRCFTCRFPKTVSKLEGQGGVCEFCQPKLIGKGSNLEGLLGPLVPFLAAFGHQVTLPKSLVFLDWRIVMGMQKEDPPRFPVTFLDEYLHWAYPAYHLDQKIYALPGLPAPWFVPVLCGQLAAQEICRRHGLKHLGLGQARAVFPRAWVHYLTYSTALRLGHLEVAKKLRRWPEVYVGPEFEDLLRLESAKGPKGVIQLGLKRLADLTQGGW